MGSPLYVLYLTYIYILTKFPLHFFMYYIGHTFHLKAPGEKFISDILFTLKPRRKVQNIHPCFYVQTK